jgi:Spondin-like TSP1 domain/Thrombospondin type 1 domain/Tyrosine-protein kinase ephrin type A/B receptor-like
MISKNVFIGIGGVIFLALLIYLIYSQYVKNKNPPPSPTITDPPTTPDPTTTPEPEIAPVIIPDLKIINRTQILPPLPTPTTPLPKTTTPLPTTTTPVPTTTTPLPTTTTPVPTTTTPLPTTTTPVPLPVVDCVVSNWSDYSECTKNCGTGTQMRTRKILKDSLNGGTPCPNLIEYSNCNTQPCPVDCVISGWSDWSKCDKDCFGGKQSRNAIIDTPALYGGKCETTQTQICNTQPCPGYVLVSTGVYACQSGYGGVITYDSNNIPSGCVMCELGKESLDFGNNVSTCTPCIPGTYSISPGSSCQKCPTGFYTSSGGSTGCSIAPAGSYVIAAYLNPELCPTGTYSSSSGATQCTSCPSGSYTNALGSISCLPCEQGFFCQGGNNVFKCPTDSISSYGSSSCTPCQSGYGSNDGIGCAPKISRIQIESQASFNTMTLPINIIYNASTSSPPISYSLDFNVNMIQIQFSNSHGNTDMSLIQTLIPISINKYTYNQTPGKSSVLPGGPGNIPIEYSKTLFMNNQIIYTLFTNSNFILKPADNLIFSFDSSFQTNKTIYCNSTLILSNCSNPPCVPTPVDCVLSDWSLWNSCSATCGTGYQTRTRVVSVPEYNGGTCTLPLTEQQPCNTQPCPIDCSYTLSDWNSCNTGCGGGTMSRTMTVNTQPQFGGKECPTFSLSQECNSSPCVTYNKSYNFSSSFRSNGYSTNQLNLYTPTVNTYLARILITFSNCVNTNFISSYALISSLKAINPNNTTTTIWKKQLYGYDNYPRENAVYELYLDANQSQKNIKNNNIILILNFSSLNSTISFNYKVEIDYNIDVDCIVSWSDWSSCSNPCNGGIQTQNGTIVSQPLYAGLACPDLLTKSRECNNQSCPLPSISTPPTTNLNQIVGKMPDTINSPDLVNGTGSFINNMYSINNSIDKTIVSTTINFSNKINLTTFSFFSNIGFYPTNNQSLILNTNFYCMLYAIKVTDYFAKNIQTLIYDTSNSSFVFNDLSILSDKYFNSDNIQLGCSQQFNGSAPSSINSNLFNLTNLNLNYNSYFTFLYVVYSPLTFTNLQARVYTNITNLTPTKTDCLLDMPSAWSNCSVTCGGGQQTRTQNVLQQALYGGSCTNQASLTQPCNTQACPIYCNKVGYTGTHDDCLCASGYIGTVTYTNGVLNGCQPCATGTFTSPLNPSTCNLISCDVTGYTGNPGFCSCDNNYYGVVQYDSIKGTVSGCQPCNVSNNIILDFNGVSAGYSNTRFYGMPISKYTASSTGTVKPNSISILFNDIQQQHIKSYTFRSFGALGTDIIPSTNLSYNNYPFKKGKGPYIIQNTPLEINPSKQLYLYFYIDIDDVAGPNGNFLFNINYSTSFNFCCNKGTFSTEHDKNCVNCPVGSWSDNGSSSCAPISCSITGYTGMSGSCVCDYGYTGSVSYNDGILSGCSLIACNSTGYTGSPGSCVCNNGYSGNVTYTNGVLNGCNLCQSGFYAMSGSSICSPCSSGSYSSISGSSGCTLCSSGYYSSQIGSTSCTSCSPGFYSSQIGSSTCNMCSSGTFSSISGSTKCDSCQLGTFSSSGASGCSPCVTGYWTSQVGSSTCNPISCSITGYTGIAGNCMCANGYTGSVSYVNGALRGCSPISCSSTGYTGTAGNCSCSTGYSGIVTYSNGVLGGCSITSCSIVPGYTGSSVNSCSCILGYTGVAINNNGILSGCSPISCNSTGYTGTAGSCVCDVNYTGTVNYTNGMLNGCIITPSVLNYPRTVSPQISYQFNGNQTIQISKSYPYDITFDNVSVVFESGFANNFTASFQTSDGLNSFTPNINLTTRTFSLNSKITLKANTFLSCLITYYTGRPGDTPRNDWSNSSTYFFSTPPYSSYFSASCSQPGYTGSYGFCSCSTGFTGTVSYVNGLSGCLGISCSSTGYTGNTGSCVCASGYSGQITYTNGVVGGCSRCPTGYFSNQGGNCTLIPLQPGYTGNTGYYVCSTGYTGSVVYNLNGTLSGCSPTSCASTGYTGNPGSCMCASGYSGQITYTNGVVGGCSPCPTGYFSNQGGNCNLIPLRPGYTGNTGYYVCSTGYTGSVVYNLNGTLSGCSGITCVGDQFYGNPGECKCSTGYYGNVVYNSNNTLSGCFSPCTSWSPILLGTPGNCYCPTGYDGVISNQEPSYSGNCTIIGCNSPGYSIINSMCVCDTSVGAIGTPTFSNGSWSGCSIPLSSLGLKNVSVTWNQTRLGNSIPFVLQLSRNVMNSTFSTININFNVSLTTSEQSDLTNSSLIYFPGPGTSNYVILPLTITPISSSSFKLVLKNLSSYTASTGSFYLIFNNPPSSLASFRSTVTMTTTFS